MSKTKPKPAKLNLEVLRGKKSNQIKLNSKEHHWCYWLQQGAMSEKLVTKRLFAFANSKYHGGLKTLLNELAWDGGTIWQVNEILINNYNRLTNKESQKGGE